MKKKLLLLALLAGSAFTQAQIVNIPDPAFKATLLAFGTSLDANSDGEIQISEAEGFAYPLVLQGTITNPGAITDLTGIEAFVNIPQLYCRYNSITQLDLSNTTLLNYIDVAHNDLTSLNVENCPLLTELYCEYNQLTNLDLSGNNALTMVLCNDNQLVSLDLSGSELLESINCSYNQLGNLDITDNPELKILSCSENGLTSLNLSTNPQLTLVLCEGNNLTTLDVSHNTLLEELGCGNNLLTSLDISNNPALTGLYCYSNNLESVDLSNAPELNAFYCSINPLTSIDVSQNPALTTFSCSQTSISSLDLSNNPNLVSILCTTNPLLTYINLKSGNNGNISLEYSNFGWLDALETVCLDDAQSALANFITSETQHPVTFIEECLPTASVSTRNVTSFSIYPNPTRERITIQSDRAVSLVQIYNILGQPVSTHRETNTIDLTGLGSGMYLIKVTDEENHTAIKQVIKQ